MTAPAWLNSVVADFGRAAGVDGFALGPSGSSAVRFANGSTLRFEYVSEELAVAMTFRLARDASAVRRLLSLANPMAARGGVRIRSGIIPKTGAAVVAVRLPERDVTLPAVNAAFAALWRAVDETGGVS